MRTQLIIVGLLVWIMALGATPTVTHAQSSAEWQTLPYQKQITEACFDAQRQYVLWQQDGNAYDIRTNTPLTTNSISADFTVTSVMCAPSGWVYYATTNITVLMGSRVGNVLPIQYYRTRLGESLQPMRYFPTSIDYFDPFQLYSVTIEPATTRNTLVIHNTCEDSLLAAPIILDLAIIMELTTRVTINGSTMHPVTALLSFLTKAPLVPKNTPCVNSLSRQRAMLENFCKALVGMPPENNMLLEYKLRQ